MKRISRKMIRTVQASTAEDFDKEFNKASNEINENTTLVWEQMPLCCHFIYEVSETIPESASEELQLQGIKYYCKDCPFFYRKSKKRVVRYDCKYSETGTVVDFSPACSHFCRMVLDGEIEPVEGK